MPPWSRALAKVELLDADDDDIDENELMAAVGDALSEEQAQHLIKAARKREDEDG